MVNMIKLNYELQVDDYGKNGPV